MLDIFPKNKRKRILTAADKKRIAAQQDWKCKGCGNQLPARFHLDHIKEFSGGGSDRESNLQVLCPNCHANKTEEERHRKKQKKIKEKENIESGGLLGGSDLLGSPSRRRKSDSILDIGGFWCIVKKKWFKKASGYSWRI